MVIESVTDNIRASDSMLFYQIVRGGLAEDARAYVDREFEWNGIDEAGMPSFLRGADYIMPFNSDKPREDFEISVRIARPADVYVFWDERVPTASWLSEKFVETGLKIGMDEVTHQEVRSGRSVERDPSSGIGSGKSIDTHFSIWKLRVSEPTTVTFGPLGGVLGSRSMYSIAAVPLATRPSGSNTESMDKFRPVGTPFASM